MRKKLLVLAAVIALSLGMLVVPAHAVFVTYSTSDSGSGPFDGGCPGYADLWFEGVSHVTVRTWPLGFTFRELGTFKVSADLCGAPISGPFSLTVYQSSPTVGSDSLYGTLTGYVSFFGSSGQAEFTSTSALIGNVLYEVLDSSEYLPAPSSGYGIGHTTVSARISATPEPSTLLLVGTGLTGLAGLDSSEHMPAPSSGYGVGHATVSARISATPEPSTLLLVGTGLTGLAGLVRRRIARSR